MRHLATAVVLALCALSPLALAQSADRPGQKAFQPSDRWEWRQLAKAPSNAFARYAKLVSSLTAPTVPTRG